MKVALKPERTEKKSDRAEKKKAERIARAEKKSSKRQISSSKVSHAADSVDEPTFVP